MIWLLALVGPVLTGIVCYWLGVRTERGKHARWANIQELLQEDRRERGGVQLKKVRVTR